MSENELKLVILDFDGTLTDLTREGPMFQYEYLKNLTRIMALQIDAGRLEELAREFEKKIRAHPEQYGWIYNGKIVGPAADPYILMSVIAEMILDHYKVASDPKARMEILRDVFRKSYTAIADRSFFKKDAWLVLETLCRLQELGRVVVYVITNSETDVVKTKLSALEAWHGKNSSLAGLTQSVIGHAQKQVLGDQPAQIPECAQIAGLARQVYLRRTIYFSVVDELRMRHKVEWKNVLVFGDNYEVDLMMLGFLGAAVHLVANPFTSAHECRHCGVEPGTDAELITTILPPIFGRI